MFRQLREQGKLLLISHHDLGSVPELFDQVLLVNGELLTSGPVADVFTQENLTRTYGTRVFSRIDHGLAT